MKKQRIFTKKYKVGDHVIMTDAHAVLDVPKGAIGTVIAVDKFHDLNNLIYPYDVLFDDYNNGPEDTTPVYEDEIILAS